MPIIEVKELNIEYARGRKSVKGCSFSIEEGEVFGLLGSNGAGKSTILQAFAGLNKNFEGEMKIFGKDIKYFGHEIFSKIAYVPQHACMFREFTVRENFRYFASMENIGGDKRENRIEELLERFALKRFENVSAARLSGGYRQLLNMALSNITEKRIILMDEPTAGLDLWAKRMVAEYINELKRKGRTIILTTHDLDEAEDLCDNAVILSDGKILGKGNIRHMLQEMGGGYTVNVYLEAPAKLKTLRLKHATQFAVLDKRIVIETNPKDIGMAIKELVVKLEKAGAKIREIEVKEPSLGYVFSSLISGGDKR